MTIKISRKLIVLVFPTCLTILLLSCVKNLSDPQWDNPFDSAYVSTHDSPYNLSADIGHGGILLNWNTFDKNPQLSGYNLYRKVDDETEFTLLQGLARVGSFIDTDIINGSAYHYYVIARSNGIEAHASGIITITINTDPVFVIESNNTTHTPTRYVSLTTIAFRAEQMIIANNLDFTEATWEDYSSISDWQLSIGSDTKTVYVQITYENGDTSEVISDSIEPLIPDDVNITIASGDTTDTYVVKLNFSAEFSDSMRIANQQDLSGVEWIAYKDSIEYWDLYGGEELHITSNSNEGLIFPRANVNLHIDNRSEQKYLKNRTPDKEQIRFYSSATGTLDELSMTIYAQFKNDFEVPSAVVSDEVVMDIQTKIVINNYHSFTSSKYVTLLLSTPDPYQMSITTGGMRARWESFNSIIENFELTQGSGTKRVYVNFRNADGEESGIIYDEIEARMVDNPSIQIINPGEETILSPLVNIALNADFAESLKISNRDDFSDVSWITYTDTIFDWDLLDVIGETDELFLSVFAVFKNSFEVNSDTVSDQVIADLGVTISINDGATSTISRFINLLLLSNNTSEIAVDTDQYQIINSPSWQTFINPLINYELSAAPGRKRVYARFRYLDESLSPIVYDDIFTTPVNPNLRILSSNDKIVNYQDVDLSMPDAEALELGISSISDSSSLNWEQYSETLTYQLPEEGWNHVYVWFRNDFYNEGPAHDSVGLDTQIDLDTIYWDATNDAILLPGDSIAFTMIIANDVFGQESEGTAIINVDGWNPIAMVDQNDGSYSNTIIIDQNTDRIREADITASFVDRAGNRINDILVTGSINAMLEVGDELTFPLGNTGVDIPLVWITAGSFMMGSPESDADSDQRERPQHEVTIDYNFWIGQFEVSQEEWRAVTGTNPSQHVGDNYPLENVSWEDAQGFLGTLNDMEEGSPWRLPSEAEWEYAARSGTNTRFPWGDDNNYSSISNYAWYSSNSGGFTHATGIRNPNQWNIYDTFGNVHEFCEDDYHQNYYFAPEDGSAWIDNPRADYRVIRGGSYSSGADNCRAAKRSSQMYTNEQPILGFRLVRSMN
ncbi:MAG: formylglycine-generating enzyme family protein [Candidatus Electryonea clarkiae]|nr:formylglycine-generating enzyme family protein [Candidatus Electryonea clarkiae]MDP8285734.1 formylglycine-generating enzyme family protein [Candidatus Electryonea clarkiae]